MLIINWFQRFTRWQVTGEIFVDLCKKLCWFIKIDFVMNMWILWKINFNRVTMLFIIFCSVEVYRTHLTIIKWLPLVSVYSCWTLIEGLLLRFFFLSAFYFVLFYPLRAWFSLLQLQPNESVYLLSRVALLYSPPFLVAYVLFIKIKCNCGYV